MDDQNIKKEVWKRLRNLNKSWTTKGRIEALKDYFHPEMVAITPDSNQRLMGGDACYQGWKQFHDNTEILDWREKNPDIRIFGQGTLAVITYDYEIRFKQNHRLIEDSGRDLYVFVKEDQNWLAVADHFSNSPAA